MINIASTTHITLPPTGSLAGYPLDWIIVGAMFVVFALFAMWNGTDRIVALFFALLGALVADTWIGNAALLSGALPRTGGATDALIFGILVCVMYVFAMRMIGLSFGSSSSPLSAILAGLALTLLIGVVWSDVAALSSIWHFGPNFYSVFSADYRFWEFILAFAALAFAHS